MCQVYGQRGICWMIVCDWVYDGEIHGMLWKFVVYSWYIMDGEIHGILYKINQ